MTRVMMPKIRCTAAFDRRAFREAFVNAMVHRDYCRLGAVHVRIDDDGLTISNPETLSWLILPNALDLRKEPAEG